MVALPVVRGGVARGRRVTGFVLVGAGLPLVTAMLLIAREELALGSVLLVYLLAVVVVSAIGGLIPGLAAAVVSFALANWFFIPPIHTLAVEGRDALIELVVFAAVAAVVAATVELAARDRLRYQHELDVQLARTRELAAEDRARAALLASVGHDLRTPLASTKAAVSSLRQADVVWPEPTRAQLLDTIEDSTDRLTRLVTNLLRHDPAPLDVDRAGDTGRPGRGGLAGCPARAARERRRPHRRRPPAGPGGPGPAGTRGREPGRQRRAVQPTRRARRVAAPRCTKSRTRAARRRRGWTSASSTTDLGSPPERWEQVFTAFQRLDDKDAGSHVGLGLAIARG